MMNLIRKACEEINSENWSNFVRPVKMEDNEFHYRDHIVDTEIEPLIIAMDEDDDSDVEYIEEDCGVLNEE